MDGRLLTPREQQLRLPERLPCPACERPTLLVTLRATMVPTRSHTAQPWGAPIVADDDQAVCNSASCCWSGPVREAYAAAAVATGRT